MNKSKADALNMAAERRELESAIARLKKTVNELAGKLNRSPDWETFNEFRDENKRLNAERDRMKHILNYMICYDPKEICKDEFAYDRLLSNFKGAAKAALREE